MSDFALTFFLGIAFAPINALAALGLHSSTCPGAPLHFLRRGVERVNPKLSLLVCGCLPCMGWLFSIPMVVVWVQSLPASDWWVVPLFPFVQVGLHTFIDELISR